jgi:hypothetical protein
MALVCAQCGTDNPAGNAFCMSCGSSLAAAPAPATNDITEDITQAVQTGPFAAPAPPVAVAPGTSLPPLSFLPPGYVPPSGPYLPAPPSGTAPAHRTSSTMLIAIVAIVLLVVSGGGVAYAALHKGGTTPAPNANIPVNVPTTAPTTAPTAAPTEPPASTAQPASTSAGGQTVSTPFAKVFVPTGFTVIDQQSHSIVMGPNNGGEDAAGVQAEPLSGATTNAQLDQDLLTGDQQSDDPSAKMCSTKAPSQTQLVGSGGPITADVISICENLTPPNGPAFAAVDGYFAGVAKAADGSFKAVWFEFLAPASSFQAFTRSIPAAFVSQTVFSDAAPPA